MTYLFAGFDVEDYFYSSFLQVLMNFGKSTLKFDFPIFVGSSFQVAHKFVGMKWHWIHMGGGCW